MTQDFFSAVRVSKFSSSSASFLPVKAPPGPHLFRFLPRLPHKKPGPQCTRYFCAPHPARFPDGNSPDAATARPPRWRWRRGWGEIKQFGGVHGNGTRDAVALPEAGLLRKFRTSRTKPVFPRGEQQATPVIPLASSNTGVACGFTTLSAIDKPAPPHENGPQPPHKGKKSPPQHPSNYISHGLN